MGHFNDPFTILFIILKLDSPFSFTYIILKKVASIFFKNISSVIYRRKKVMQVWYKMRVSELQCSYLCEL